MAFSLGFGSAYSAEEARRWLLFLAANMSLRDKVVFELVDLQYDWVRWSKWSLFVANLIQGLVIGLFVSLFVGLFITIFVNFFVGLAISILGGTILDILFGLFFKLSNTGLLISLIEYYKRIPIIEVRDKIEWTWHFYLKSLKDNLIALITSGMFFGLIFGWTFGIIGGFIFGWAYILFASIDDYLDNYKNSILQITHPYERFNASARVLHFSILQHKHLLYLLSKKGLLPYRLVAFLDAMVKQHILESDGATWRFRHGLLQKYFSEQGFE